MRRFAVQELTAIGMQTNRTLSRPLHALSQPRAAVVMRTMPADVRAARVLGHSRPPSARNHGNRRESAAIRAPTAQPTVARNPCKSDPFAVSSFRESARIASNPRAFRALVPLFRPIAVDAVGLRPIRLAGRPGQSYRGRPSKRWPRRRPTAPGPGTEGLRTSFRMMGVVCGRGSSRRA